MVLAASSVPERDRSRELSDYPADLLDSPPQVAEADIVVERAPIATVALVDGASRAHRRVGARLRAPGAGASLRVRSLHRSAPECAPARARGVRPRLVALRPAPAPEPPARRRHSEWATASARARALPLPTRAAARGSRSALTDLMTRQDMGTGLLLFTLATAMVLGAFHALEPGHGKTVVAAYLVGSRGTAWHAVLLGLAVTVSHTAGVFLLGAVTLYASRYVMPDRLYPWLGAISGLAIAGVGLALLRQRWRGEPHDRATTMATTHAQRTPRASRTPHGHAHGHTTIEPHDHAHDGRTRPPLSRSRPRPSRTLATLTPSIPR